MECYVSGIQILGSGCVIIFFYYGLKHLTTFVQYYLCVTILHSVQSVTKRLGKSNKDTQSLSYQLLVSIISALALPYPEHLCPTCGTYTLSCWPLVLHSY